MTQKVPGERSQGAHPSPWNSPGLPSREARFTAWFLVYGIHFGLFGLSWVLVFVNPLTSVMPTFAAGPWVSCGVSRSRGGCHYGVIDNS
jgi:hypothetical protein